VLRLGLNDMGYFKKYEFKVKHKEFKTIILIAKDENEAAIKAIEWCAKNDAELDCRDIDKALDDLFK
jgi:hypothetical protein